MTKKQMFAVARDEVEAWNLNHGLVMAILFCYIHRLGEGESFEQTFPCRPITPPIDFQI